MIDLTKIFSGMDKGPEDIDENFKKVNQALDQIVGANVLNWAFYGGNAIQMQSITNQPIDYSAGKVLTFNAFYMI